MKTKTPGPAAPRASCPDCRARVRVKTDGEIYRHAEGGKPLRLRDPICTGSGKRAAAPDVPGLLDDLLPKAEAGR